MLCSSPSLTAPFVLLSCYSQQAQLYFAGKSRYIGVFDSREKAATAYEIAREKLKEAKVPSDNSAQGLKSTEAAVNMARKAAFDGVNEKDPRVKKNKG